MHRDPDPPPSGRQAVQGWPMISCRSSSGLRPGLDALAVLQLLVPVAVCNALFHIGVSFSDVLRPAHYSSTISRSNILKAHHRFADFL